MSENDLRNEEILEEEVDGNSRHGCLSSSKKRCESDCWPINNCYISCSR